MASVTCVDSSYSGILMGAAWVSDTEDISWGPGSSESSFQSSLGRGMLDYFLRCHFFVRVNFSCVASSECYYTKFFQFTGTVPFLICSKVDNVFPNTTCYWGGYY